MWEVRRGSGADNYEMLSPRDVKDGLDSDTSTLTPVRYGVDSYQNTSYLIIYVLTGLTAVFSVFTFSALGASIASSSKQIFGIDGIMPSVTLASGDCDQLKYVNWSLDLINNSLGTAIIACSNYLQQSTPLLPPLIKYAQAQRSKISKMKWRATGTSRSDPIPQLRCSADDKER
jgi:hypothetical protein